MEPIEVFRQNLREYMLEKRLISQAALARKSNVPPKKLNGFLHGRKDGALGPKPLARIATALGMTYSQMVAPWPTRKDEPRAVSTEEITAPVSGDVPMMDSVLKALMELSQQIGELRSEIRGISKKVETIEDRLENCEAASDPHEGEVGGSPNHKPSAQ
jgi:transcriptional regulator with XRE-family HTH domain